LKNLAEFKKLWLRIFSFIGLQIQFFTPSLQNDNNSTINIKKALYSEVCLSKLSGAQSASCKYGIVDNKNISPTFSIFLNGLKISKKINTKNIKIAIKKN